MEDPQSITKNDSDDNFFDAFDEFPFYDAMGDSQSPHSVAVSESSSTPELTEENPNVSVESKNSPESPSPAGICRRRSLSQKILDDISRNNSKGSSFDNSSVSLDSITTSSTNPMGRKYRFSRILIENAKEIEKSGSPKVRFASNTIDNRLKEEVNENSTITTVDDKGRMDDSISITVDSRDSSSNFIFSLAGFIITAIGFHLNLLVTFFTSPIWLLRFSYMFMIDPFRAMRRGRDYLVQKILRVWGLLYDKIKSVLSGWLKRHKKTLQLVLRLAWGFLWSVYVCFVLVSLLVCAFVVSGIFIRCLVEEPVRMKEELNFDYTKDSPVAFVPIISCPELSCGEGCSEKIELGSTRGARAIPSNHKLQVTVSLTLPESDYNRYLGIFQVRIDFLSANGSALASSRQPCMLQFKSQPIRLLSTFLKIVPIVTGYISESQTLDIKFRGFRELNTPSTCLRVVMEQRAEFRAGAGIPELYAASLNLESELPLLKRILWSWKRTIFIWTSTMIFTMELLFTLLCCKPIIIPKGSLRGGSSESNASQNVQPARPKGASPESNVAPHVHPAQS